MLLVMDKMFSIFLEFLLTLKNITFAFLVSWIQFFIPPSRKCVQGEIVLVTGSAAGIGQRLAVEFAKMGAITVLWDINKSGLDKTKEMIEEVGGKCFTYACDVR